MSDLDSRVAIRVAGLGKKYFVYDRPQHRLIQMLRRGRRSLGHNFWAARDVSFQIENGEMFGVIGRNGSGKSTLLQLLAGTLSPTEGSIQIRGRVGALLELGSGFNPDFTGRENVYVNGAILGLSRAEIEARFEAIQDFAEIGEFIDQPVRLYSSGMFVRLAFSVATSLDTDILLVDEALAVGDVFFRQKCYGRLEEMRARGVSIVLVSHALGDILQYCKNALVMDRGESVFLGPASEAVERYYLLEQTEKGRAASTPTTGLCAQGGPNGEYLEWPEGLTQLDISGLPQVSDGKVRCARVAVCNARGLPTLTFEQGEEATFYYEFEALQDIEVPIGGVQIQNDRGVIVHGKTSLQHGSAAPPHVARGTRVRFRHVIRLEIAVGEYTFDVGLTSVGSHDYALRRSLSHFDLDARVSRLCLVTKVARLSVVWRLGAEGCQLLHHGVANLPGACWIGVDASPGPAPALVGDNENVAR